MSLESYRIPTEKVTVDGQDGEVTFVVRGLSATAISALIRSQGETMQGLYVRAISNEFDVGDVETLLQILLDESPLLVALIIAFGVGEPEQWQTAQDMPFADQTVLIDAIVRMTFAREGGVKKVIEIIKRAMTQAEAHDPRKA